MKKFLSIIAMFCLAISIFTFSGCAVTLKTGPNKNDPVSSNGGLVVRKGDYIYFANGFISNSNLSGKDNNYGEARNGAIYRAKLVNGELMYNVKEDKDGNEVKTLKNVELVCPMVAGFEYTNIYIFGDTLYFTTPNTEKDSTGKVRFDLTDVYAVSIKGGKVKRIVNALNLTNIDNIKYSYLNGKVYLTYLNDNKLYNVRINGQKVENKTTIATSVSSFVLPSEESQFVYYTRAIKDDEKTKTGNVLAKTDLKSNKETVIRRDNRYTYAVLKVSADTIFYTKTDNFDSQAKTYIYSNDLENFNEKEKQLTAIEYSSSNQFVFTLAGYDNAVVAYKDDDTNSKLLLVTGTNDINADITTLYEGKFTVLKINGTKIYGKDSDGNIVRIDIVDKTTDIIVSKDVESKLDINSNFDIENGYVYYNVKYSGDSSDGYYLNRTYLNSANHETELVGVLLSKHIKTTK